MTGAVTVRARAIGKCFRRVHERPMRVREALMLLTTRGARVEDLWAVRDLSFEVRQGETLGVLGSNGSGKSTLLMLVAGTAFPTEGVVSVRGRVTALLSLGSGFHPDMTGEENILLAAGLVGIPVPAARRLVPKIIDFAELGDAIDTPFRYYSSGMAARLGFSVAIHVSPDVLVLDEVLAVGDIAFQTKCLAELKRLQRRGITILFASQSPAAIGDFCTHALWLEAGRLVRAGEARVIANAYLEATLGGSVASAEPLSGML